MVSTVGYHACTLAQLSPPYLLSLWHSEPGSRLPHSCGGVLTRLTRMGVGGALRFFLLGISRAPSPCSADFVSCCTTSSYLYPHHDHHLHFGFCLNLPSWRLSFGCAFVCVLVQRPSTPQRLSQHHSLQAKQHIYQLHSTTSSTRTTFQLHCRSAERHMHIHSTTQLSPRAPHLPALTLMSSTRTSSSSTARTHSSSSSSTHARLDVRHGYYISSHDITLVLQQRYHHHCYNTTLSPPHSLSTTTELPLRAPHLLSHYYSLPSPLPTTQVIIAATLSTQYNSTSKTTYITYYLPTTIHYVQHTVFQHHHKSATIHCD
eukprot:220303-Amphidinium_carterae.2